MICNCFLQSTIIFYENNSSDLSNEMLVDYCNANKNAVLITEDYDINKFERTVRLARGRNICLGYM